MSLKEKKLLRHLGGQYLGKVERRIYEKNRHGNNRIQCPVRLGRESVMRMPQRVFRERLDAFIRKNFLCENPKRGTHYPSWITRYL